MTEFWKGTLSPAEKGIYDAIRSAAAAGKPSAAVMALPNPNAVKNAFNCFCKDHPEIYNVSPSIGAGMQLVRLVIRLSYIYDRAKVKAVDTYLREYSKRIVSEAPKTELEKEFKIIDEMAREVNYAINNVTNQNAAAALYFKTAQCSGISKAFKYAMDVLGVWCIVVDGEVYDPNSGKHMPHAWNMIRIDGTYYYTDVTMMMGANSTKAEPFRYHRINCSAKTFSDNGYKWDQSDLPKCDRDMTASEMPRSSAASQQQTQQRVNYGSATSGGTRIVPASGNGKVFSRLYDVKNHIRDCLENNKLPMEFTLDIPQYTQQKLMSMISDLIQKQSSELNLRVRLQIQMTGNSVKIKSV